MIQNLADTRKEEAVSSGDLLTEEAAAAHVVEADAVFGQEWICVGHAAMFPAVGDYLSIDLIGNPLVIVRTSDRIRTLSRVCLHRWATIVEGAGNARLFTCPFHAWAYSLDGALLVAPHMESADGFDPAGCRLAAVRTEIMEETGLIFINLSTASGSDADPPSVFFEAGLSDAVAAGAHKDETHGSNWKDLIDEALEQSPDVHLLLPNVLLWLNDGVAKLQLLYPDGPNITLVRTIGLLGAAAPAPPRTAPICTAHEYVGQRIGARKRVEAFEPPST